jgi:quercetin dioxygenase-like cupin family protein
MGTTGSRPSLQPKIVAPGDGVSANLPGYTTTVKIFAAECGGQVLLAEVDATPGAGPPLHQHTYEDEMFYVLEGEFEITFGEDKHTVKAGSTVLAPRGIPHRFIGSGDRGGKLISVIMGDNFEKFYAKYESALAEETPDWTRAAQVAQEHGIILLEGPPGT